MFETACIISSQTADNIFQNNSDSGVKQLKHERKKIRHRRLKTMHLEGLKITVHIFLEVKNASFNLNKGQSFISLRKKSKR